MPALSNRDDKKQSRDPLAPVEFIVGAIGTLFIAFVVFGGLVVVFTDHVSVAGFGKPYACASYSSTAFTRGGPDRDPNPLVEYPQALPSAPDNTYASRFVTCEDHPTGLMNALARSSTVVDLGFSGAGLFMLWRLTRTARREGIFTESVARRLYRLGWFLLLGTLAVAVAKAFINGSLTHLLAGAPLPWVWVNSVDIPLTMLIVGFGLLTLGRVMFQAVTMREEIDSTV